MAYRKIFDAKGKTREEWLEVRRIGLGGSDMAAVLGYSKWRSPLDVWLDKTGRTEPETEENDFIHFGNVLEPIVAQEFAERSGKKVRNNNYTLQSEEHPFLLANIDREITGEDAGLECKTASAFKAKEWEGDAVPDDYYIQCQHYMAVTGKSSWWIACLCGGNQFFYKEIPRNEDIIQTIIEQGRIFWQMVQDDTMPAVDGSTACSEALKQMHPQGDGSIVELEDTAKIYIEQFKQAKADEAEAKARKTEAQNALCDMLKKAEKGNCGEYTVSWSNKAGRTSFDYKSLLKEHGEKLPWLETYLKTGSPTRSFSIKG